jgi:hypothetical protein
MSWLNDLGAAPTNPLVWAMVGFQIWMLVDAIRRQEWIWAIFIFFFSILSAGLYFFFVYWPSRGERAAWKGFELPGAYDRKRIKELEAKIHHLDKAHHHLELGDIYLHQGKWEKAEACYRAALEREPEDPEARAHLGQCLLRKGKVAEAKPLLEGVSRLNPKHEYGYTLMALAETHGALGETDAAIRVWEQVLQFYSYSRAKVQLAELLAVRGETARAKKYVEEVIADEAHVAAAQRRREKVWVKRAQALLRKLK